MLGMKIVAVADLHGDLPELPPADLVLLAGDICPTWSRAEDVRKQAAWLESDFRPWLESLQAARVIGIAGNHDVVFARAPECVPSLPWTYLQDSGCRFRGYGIWGTPWARVFDTWPFMLPEHELNKKWRLIPEDTDILLVHGPAFGLGDTTGSPPQSAGSVTLRARLNSLAPMLTVCGHIHEGRGLYLLSTRPSMRTALVANVARRYMTFELH